MLLLTDDLVRGAELRQVFEAAQTCEMLGLDQALKQPATHGMIACYAALDPGTSTKVRAALAHHRKDPLTPVLFLTDTSSVYASMQATALGSTKTLPRETPRDELIATLKRLLATVKVAPRGPASRTAVEASIQEIGTALWTILEAARQRQAIPLAVLDRSADALLLSIRRTEIRAWLDVVRRYDDITFQHSLLVAGLVTGFAARLGIAAPSQRLLAQAALVHDVGKAVIPRHILNKSGSLSPAEQAVMRTHPVAGYDMLARQKGITPGILGIVRHHHEYLDGSGYPDRLRGTQISDLVRLVTICDIFAALTERRSYKPAMAPQPAYAMLLDMGGTLDASLLKAFGRFVADM